MRHHRALTTAVAAALVASGCASRANVDNATELAACAPTEGSVSIDTADQDLSGAYRLILFAATGAKAGEMVQGWLTLNAYVGELRQMTSPGGTPMASVITPYFGATDVELDAVGAIRVGDGTSIDPMRPGVLVIQQNTESSSTPSSVTIRIGSESNRRGRTAFDGGYMALRVGQVTAQSITGSWASGVTTRIATGHFCAFRD